MSLCLSLRGDDPEGLVRRLAEVAGVVPRVEIRLEGAPNPFPWEIMKRWKGDWIVACQEGPDRSSRLAEAAAVGAPYIDIPHDLASIPVLLEGTQAIWSWHEKPSQDSDLAEILHMLEQKSRPGDICKIVAWAEQPEAAARVFRLFESSKSPLLAFAQGPGGAASRIWATSLGSPWTYVCWPGEETAPGQWNWQEALAWSSPGKFLFGVVGDSVSHSRSPLLWNEAFRRMSGGGGAYASVSTEDFPDFLASHSHSAFGGFSVTAPFKRSALDCANKVDEAAQNSGAANFIHRDDGGVWAAYQTDGPGAFDCLRDVGLVPECRVLILGAGGAARGAAFEALKCGHEVVLAARCEDAAIESAASLGRFGSIIASSLTDFDLSTVGAVIQATPVGSLEIQGNLLEGHTFNEGTLVLDMVYAPAWTQLLKQAKQQGGIPIPGRKMLVRQMIRQFSIATGLSLEAAPLDGLVAAHISDSSIVLIGPRASGKTTLGNRLAKALGWRFCDIDEELELAHGRTIAEWIPNDEPGFRIAEAGMIASIIPQFPRSTVFALGGGAVENQVTRTLLASLPRVLTLTAPSEVLFERSRGQGRPALTSRNPLEEIEFLVERRMPFEVEVSDGNQVEVSGSLNQAWDALLRALDWDPC